MNLIFFRKLHIKWNITAAPVVAVMFLLSIFGACSAEHEHMAEAIRDQDTVAFMTARGVSNLISDSGVIRYKVIAEDWDMYQQTQPPRWEYLKGILLEKFDDTFHAEWIVQADTAYCYNESLWLLRGRVFIRNQEGTRFHTEELYWDMQKHEIYSHLFMHVITPEREIQGYRFRSNEAMTDYIIYDFAGNFPMNDEDSSPTDSVMRDGPQKPNQP